MSWRLLTGDCRNLLPTLDAGSVQCVVTSPPYWGLRDYGVDGQLGVEHTVDIYVEHLVAVFRAVRHVLRDDGTLWLNLGDSYAGSWGAQSRSAPVDGISAGQIQAHPQRTDTGSTTRTGLPAKNLVGIPWRVAFALQADGWVLRSDIIWAKPNPMPESVQDRPTRAHEYLFLLTKQPRYYYAADAIKEPSITEDMRRPYGSQGVWDVDGRPEHQRHGGQMRTAGTNGANKRSVWTIRPRPFPGAHFATFPPALVEPCIKAGSRPAGRRCECDELILTPTGRGPTDDPTLTTGRAGWNRVRRANEGRRPIARREQRDHAEQLRASPHQAEMASEAGVEAFAHYLRTDRSGARPIPPDLLVAWTARGWLAPTAPCACPEQPSDLILDPFAGSGTTGAVACGLGRQFLGIELNADYAAMARVRIAEADERYQGGPLLRDHAPITEQVVDG